MHKITLGCFHIFNCCALALWAAGLILGYQRPLFLFHFQAQPCPNGTYGEQRGLSSAAGCSPCPAGKFCYTDGMDPPGIPHPVSTAQLLPDFYPRILTPGCIC